MDGVEPKHTDNNEVKGNDVVQYSWNDQNQNACTDRNDVLQVGSVEAHENLPRFCVRIQSRRARLKAIEASSVDVAQQRTSFETASICR
jgi:hypothetical protein